MSVGLIIAIFLGLTATGAAALVFARKQPKKPAEPVPEIANSQQAALTEKLETVVERLKHSQRIAGLANWEYEPQTDTLYWSEEVYRLISMNPATPQPDLEAVMAMTHPDDREKVLEAVDKCSTQGGTYEVTKRVTCADGREIVLREYGDPVFDEAGNLIKVLGISQDITGLVRTEEALREREAHRSSLLATSTAAIVSADVKGHHTYWNRAFEVLIGYSGDEIKKLIHTEVSHPDDLEQASQVFKSLRNGEIDEYRREKRYLRKDGTTFWGDLSASAVRNDDGELIEIVGVVIDITDQKRAEEALREREATLSLVLEKSYDGLISFRPVRDGSGKVIDLEYGSINELAIKILGTDPSGRTMLEMFPSSPETGMFNNYVEAIETGKPFHIEHNFDGVLGGDPWLRIVAVPTGDGITVGMTDITDQKRAEEALREREALFSRVLESSYDGLLTLQPIRNETGAIVDFLYLSANDSAIKILGQDPTGRTRMEAFPSEREDGMFQQYIEIMETGQPVRTEMQFTGVLDGDPWYRVVAVPTGDGITVGFNDITEIKNAEQALRESEHYHRSLLAHSNVGIFSNAPDGHLVYWNTAFESMLGYSEQEMTELTAYTLSHPSDKGPAKERFNKLVKGDADHFRRQKQYRRKDGSGIWVDVSSTAIRDADGNVTEILSIAADIAERKAAEEALQRNEARHRGILANSSAAIMSTDIDGNFVFWNSAFEQLIDYNAEQLSTMNIAEINPPNELPIASINFQKLKDGEVDSIHREKQYLRRDGSTVWGDLSVSVIRDTDGELSQMVGVVTDISDKKRAENVLREREALLSSVLEISFDGLVTLKVIRGVDGDIEDFEYTSAAGSAVEILGQDPVGKRFFEVFPSGRETRQFDRYVQVVETQEAVDIESQYEGTLPGNPWLRLVSVPMIDGLAIAFTDVTEQKNAEEALKAAYAEMEARVESRTRELQSELVQRRRTQTELERAKQQADEANLAKSEFLSRMSHELRTPMNAIMGFGQLLQHDKKTRLTGDQPQYVDEIMMAGDHLMMLISQLLDMAKIETGNMEISLTCSPAAPLIEECLAMTRSLADSQGINLRNGAQNLPPPPVNVDPLRFKQILLNLVSNAIKYNRHNGEVLIEWNEAPKGFLRVSVTDQGDGVPADQFESVFEPFNRAGAENANVPGTGIGLAIAKQMTELMGGSIGLDSEPGVGSTFWFSVPLATEPVDASLPRPANQG